MAIVKLSKPYMVNSVNAITLGVEMRKALDIGPGTPLMVEYCTETKKITMEKAVGESEVARS